MQSSEKFLTSCTRDCFCFYEVLIFLRWKKKKLKTKQRTFHFPLKLFFSELMPHNINSSLGLVILWASHLQVLGVWTITGRWGIRGIKGCAYVLYPLQHACLICIYVHTSDLLVRRTAVHSALRKRGVKVLFSHSACQWQSTRLRCLSWRRWGSRWRRGTALAARGDGSLSATCSPAWLSWSGPACLSLWAVHPSSGMRACQVSPSLPWLTDWRWGWWSRCLAKSGNDWWHSLDDDDDGFCFFFFLFEEVREDFSKFNLDR